MLVIRGLRDGSVSEAWLLTSGLVWLKKTRGRLKCTRMPGQVARICSGESGELGRLAPEAKRTLKCPQVT